MTSVNKPRHGEPIIIVDRDQVTGVLLGKASRQFQAFLDELDTTSNEDLTIEVVDVNSLNTRLLELTGELQAELNYLRQEKFHSDSLIAMMAQEIHSLREKTGNLEQLHYVN